MKADIAASKNQNSITKFKILCIINFINQGFYIPLKILFNLGKVVSESSGIVPYVACIILL